MTRSTEFDATVKHGTRMAQPDIVVHLRRDSEPDDESAGPRVGLVVGRPSGRRYNDTAWPAGCVTWPGPCSANSNHPTGW